MNFKPLANAVKRLSLLSAAFAFTLLAACGGGGGSSPPPAIAAPFDFTATPAAVNPGQTVTLTWGAPQATACTASGGWGGERPTAGSQVVTPTTPGTSTYVLSCGGETKTVTVAVTAQGPAPTPLLTVSPSAIKQGEKATLTWSSALATSCAASGDWGGIKALDGALELSPATGGNFVYALSCLGPGGRTTVTATLDVAGDFPNVVPIYLERVAHSSFAPINAPFVSVTVCAPGTDQCQTIDHILLDTGSTGLRLISPGVVSPSLALPAVTNVAGVPVGECAQFISGFTWGAVRRADVKMGGEFASSIPVELIGDPETAFSTVPVSCSSSGANQGTVARLGANGILGVGLFKEDCGLACERQAIPGTYYACTSAGCTPSALPRSSQVSNPVTAFDRDNNGVLVSLPEVPPGGVTTATGTLTFGLGTKSNNLLEQEVTYKPNQQGNFTTTYKGVTYSASFLDTGANGLFFHDASIPACLYSASFFCPASPLRLSATNSSADGSSSGTLNFVLEGVDSLSFQTAAASIGGSSPVEGLGNTFVWGLPFFFNRKVFVAVEGGWTQRGMGPFWAY